MTNDSSAVTHPQLAPDVCLTCLGAGEIANERGPARCPDCDGTGQLGDVYQKTQQQLREIEIRARKLSGETAADVAWLIDELRSCRQALLKVLSAAQEDTCDPALLRKIRYFSNDALEVYKVRPSEEP